MTPFLKQVALHYFNPESTDHNCYIFPNRRSLLFFKKYYSQLVSKAGLTVFCPQMYTIADFMYRLGGKVPTDRIDLILCLYDCYKELMNPCESLDEFIFWGEMILGDFNDVDKYLIDAKKIFTNVDDFKKLQGNPRDYLDEEQIKALSAFLKNCIETEGNQKAGKYKENFRKTWELLYPLYTSFRESLREQGKAYDGMVYRELAEKAAGGAISDILQAKFPESQQFIFIGLNAPTDSELKILDAVRKAGQGKFCWDYSSKWIKDQDNKSSFFLHDHVIRFGQDIELDSEGLEVPEINILSVPSSVGQCKQLGEIFRRTCTDSDGKPHVPGIETAVVLPEESLLIPTLNALPEDIEKVNVTMGYPMSGSLVSALVDAVCSMQMHVRKSSEGSVSFYHRQAYDIFANPLFKQALNEDEKQKIEAVKSEHRHYIASSDLRTSEDGIVNLIFSPAIASPSAADAAQIHRLCAYLKNVIKTTALRIRSREEDSIELDFAKEYYAAIERLDNFDLDIAPSTFFRLLANLVRSSAVPFKGEPLQGLQIMGPLETRALDFDNVIILSCNEGVFPRHTTSESFIPAELKRGFGLPSHEYQDALWAYYFYRLIQRAKKVWLVMNTGNDQKIGSIEESRYIKQLELGFGAKLNRYIATSVIKADRNVPTIPKTQEHIDILKAKHLSASSLKKYLSCPAQFYFAEIEGLGKPDEVKEFLDAGMQGTVFHAVMQDLYGTRSDFTAADISAILKDKARIEESANKHIAEQLNTTEITGRTIIYRHLILQYVYKTLETDLKLLEEKGCKLHIHNLEKTFYATIGGFSFKGKIDRLDSLTAGTVRVVDYKTGKVGDKDKTDDITEDTIAAIFGPKNEDRPVVSLQMLIYDLMVREKYKGKILENAIYQPSALFKKAGPVSGPVTDETLQSFEKALTGFLEKLKDTTGNWEKSGEEKTCGYCDFKTICGK